MAQAHEATRRARSILGGSLRSAADHAAAQVAAVWRHAARLARASRAGLTSHRPSLANILPATIAQRAIVPDSPVTELERLFRRQFWFKLFWLVVTIGDLVFCLVGAVATTPGLLLSWRGAALLLVSALYGGRMVFSVWRAWFKPRVVNFTLAPAQATRVWGTTLALTLALFALHPMMGWLAYPLFGMAFSMFDLPWAILPGLVSFVMIPLTLVANGFATIADLTSLGSLGSWALAFGAYGAMTYWPARMMRDHIRREISMAELEHVHGELQEAHRQLAASAEREREVAVLRERGRLARDMHDTLGHALVLIAVKLEAARRLREIDAPRSDHELAMTQQIVRDAMAELRASLAALRSPVLERESPGRMLAEFAHEAGQRAGWHVVYDIATDLGTVDAAAREALLRVGTEALTNAERHAHARTVTVTLKRDLDDAIVLRVVDDGVGLSSVPTAADTAHYGLTGMRERVTGLGGRFSAAPGTAGGTVVEAHVPSGGPAAVITPEIGPEAAAAVAATMASVPVAVAVGSATAGRGQEAAHER